MEWRGVIWLAVLKLELGLDVVEGGGGQVEGNVDMKCVQVIDEFKRILSIRFCRIFVKIQR